MNVFGLVARADPRVVDTHGHLLGGASWTPSTAVLGLHEFGAMVSHVEFGVDWDRGDAARKRNRDGNLRPQRSFSVRESDDQRSVDRRLGWDSGGTIGLHSVSGRSYGSECPTTGTTQWVYGRVVRRSGCAQMFSLRLIPKRILRPPSATREEGFAAVDDDLGGLRVA